MSDYPTDEELLLWDIDPACQRAVDDGDRDNPRQVPWAYERYWLHRGVDWAWANPAPQEPPTPGKMASAVLCAHCEERAAVCVGAYEGHMPVAPACDVCCGHGNEDGWCVHLSDHRGVVERLSRLALLDDDDTDVPAEPTEAPKPTSGGL